MFIYYSLSRENKIPPEFPGGKCEGGLSFIIMMTDRHHLIKYITLDAERFYPARQTAAYAPKCFEYNLEE